VAGNKTPAIFGMNFQSVSVGQKTVDPTLTCDPARSVYGPNANAVKDKCNEEYVPGGYFGNGAFTPQMEGATHYENGITTPGAMNFVDASLGAMVKELKAKHLYDSTEIIIEAKHGQSPINPDKLAKIGHKVGDVLAAAHVNVAQLTDDDVALVWLADQSQTDAAVAALEADKAGPNTAHIEKVLHGAELAKLYNDPKTDPHTPDLIVLPTPGTIYTHSVAKVAEHGGFAPDDTHVALLVVNGSGHGTVDESVTTTQIAPTILKTLGLSPSALDAVKMEGTKPLPGSGD
jgi:arylsulfatase A-like enzyme